MAKEEEGSQRDCLEEGKEKERRLDNFSNFPTTLHFETCQLARGKEPACYF